jgi:hypothetical protein
VPSLLNWSLNRLFGLEEIGVLFQIIIISICQNRLMIAASSLGVSEHGIQIQQKSKGILLFLTLLIGNQDLDMLDEFEILLVLHQHFFHAFVR